MEFKDVIFYNHYGVGDLWVSSEFVKHIMHIIPASSYEYAHTKDPHLLFDLKGVRSVKLNEYCMMREPYVIIGDSLYINTWIGYAYGKYVFPGVTCSLANYKRMFNDTLESLGYGTPFNRANEDYVPDPNYQYLDDTCISNVDNFIFENLTDTIVLICNGEVQSNQAFNFDFTPIINVLADTFTTVKFIITEDIANKPTNVYLARDIICKDEGSELPEISYLSSYADVIIGRSSGPFVFTQTENNYADEHKIIISFTYEKECAHMLTQEESTANLYWSNLQDTGKIIDYLTDIIKNREEKYE
jgi:hypothetical protein